MKMLIATVLTLVGLSAQAAVDNQVDINLSATIGRSCLIDLANAAAPASVSSVNISGIDLQLDPRQLAEQHVVEIPVYETCNEDYKIQARSLNGGMKHDASAFVHGYSLKYANAVGAYLTMPSSAFVGAGQPLPRTIALWRSVDPVNRPEGSTPFFQEYTLTLTFDKKSDLPAGNYSDVITAEMATAD